MKPFQWFINILSIFLLLCFMGFTGTFIFGILTINFHYVQNEYSSKWFFADLKRKGKKLETDLTTYIHQIDFMTRKEIIQNMAVELYKLNEISCQKLQTIKWTLRFFSFSLIIIAIFFGFLIFAIL